MRAGPSLLVDRLYLGRLPRPGLELAMSRLNRRRNAFNQLFLIVYF
jgi:hypothetical protein